MTKADFKPHARTAGIFSMVLGAIVALGWIGDLPVLITVLPGAASMKLSSAISFMLAGLSLHAHTWPKHAATRTRLARGAAYVSLTLTSLTLAEHLFRRDLGAGAPGHMAPNTALGFALVSAALVMLDARSRFAAALAQVCGLASFSLAFVAVVGYTYGVRALYGVSGYSAMAIHTALGLLVLSAGVLAVRAEHGVLAVLTRDESASVVGRRVAPLILITPFALGWLCLHGQQLGLYGTEFGFAIMVFACTSGAAFIWLWQARAQSDLQAEQRWVAQDQRFLIEIGDMLRARISPDDTLFQVACRLGQYMNVSRCFFSEQNELRDLTITHRDYAKDLPSFAGTRPLSSYPQDVLTVLRAGHVLVSNDLEADPRTAADYERAYRSIGMRARVGVPLLRGGEWVGTLLVSTHEAKVWSAREIALVEVVAEKTWVWFEHLRMLNALQEREQDLAVTMSSIGDGLITTDRAGNVRSMNPVAERLTGWSLEAARGKPLAEVFRIVSEDTRAALESPVQTLLQGESIAGHAERRLLIAGDGSECPITDSGAPIRGAGGEIRGVVLVFRDATLERAAAHALEESEALKSSILGSAFDGIVSMDPHGIVLEWNPAAERMFGRTRDEAIGQSMMPLLAAAGQPEPSLGRTFELTATRKDGSTFEAEIVVTRAQARGSPLFTAFVRDISERQRLARERDLATEALQTSVKRFRGLVDASAQIVWSATASGEVVEDSPSWRAFTGQTQEEWRKARSQVLHPDDTQRVGVAWAEARAQKRAVEMEFRLRRADGEWRWMAMRGVPVTNPDGSVREWVGMNIDISERRAAEEMRRLTERMRERGRFFELSLDLVCVIGAQGQLLERNPSFTHTLGYGADELIAQPFLSLVHEDDQESTARELEKLSHGERNSAFTNRCLCKDGSYRTLQWRAAPDEAGLIYATARDITEDQRKARALAESEERLRILIEGARDYSIIMLDPNGHVTTWNAGAERIQGYRPSEILGRHFSIFYTGPDLARHHPDNELVLAREHGRYEEEGWRVRKDGSRFWANVVISALRDRDGALRGFAKVTRDFTERQRARAELEARESSLAASLKERELLLQEVHHRVKNNLQVIASLISMQIRKLKDGPSREALDECRARVQAIALIHEQLYRSHDFSSVPFSSYARNLATNIFQTAGLSPASVKLQLNMESVVLPVDKAIPCGLILNELLTNALKHAFPSDRHGSVSVELQPTSEGGISLVVADDGVGIAEDFSIEKSRSLGMQLVATLVEQLGGELSIRREGGTAFGITIPANAA